MEREAIGRGGKPKASFAGAAPRHCKAELMLRALATKGHPEVLSDTLHPNVDYGTTTTHGRPERTRPGADGRKQSVRVGKTSMMTGGTNTPARTG
jgi:hypothetical protein